MTAARFRSLALGHPGVIEAAHMNHPDFRVGGKIFASLGSDESWGMVKLTPGQQELFLALDAGVYEPAAGAWGRGGATIVRLRGARVADVTQALKLAWRNTAPKRLVREHEAG